MSETIVEIKEDKLPQKSRVLWLKSLSAVELKNYKYAISLCQAVLKEEPGFLDARVLARRCAFKEEVGEKKKSFFGSGTSTSKLNGQIKKDVKAGLLAVEQELEKDPANADINELLYEFAVQHSMCDTAIFALETVRKGAPDNTKMLHKLASHYLSRDMPQEAIGVYQDIVKQDPTDMDAMKGEKDATARASMKAGAWESGGLEDSKKDSSAEKDSELSDRAGMTRKQKKAKLAKLFDIYNADQNNLEAVLEIAGIYEEFRQFDSAHNFYDWAYQLSHKDENLKMKAEDMKDKMAAKQIKRLEEKLQVDPNNAELEASLLVLKQERSKESVEESQKRVDQNPTDPQLRFDLGLALYNSGDFNGAIPHLQQAKRNPHIRTRVLLTLGRSFDAKGMFDIAISQLDEAMEELSAMNGTKKEILYEMGLIHIKMESKDKALGCFKQIYEVDYGYRDVAQRVEQAYES